MKRITMATLVLCLVATLQVMGQTTAAQTAKPATKPTPKHTTNSTSATVAKGQKSEVAPRTASSTPVGAVRREEAERARLRVEAERARLREEAERARRREAERAREAMNSSREGIAAGQVQAGTQPTTISAPEDTAAGLAQAETLDATDSPPEEASTEQASEVALKCSGPERKPCSEQLVRDLEKRAGEKRPEHPALANIKTLNLASADGTLSCRQSDGRPCTREQVKALNEHVASPLKCNVVFEYSMTGSRTSTSSKK